LASNNADNKEANPTQESDSNDSLDKKWDAFYDLKDTQTDVSYINQLLAPETLDIKYVTNSRSNGLRALGSCSASLSIFSCHFFSSRI
jgi:spore cortex formation protein SpoVR/YcgB (stage V sporulation)